MNMVIWVIASFSDKIIARSLKLFARLLLGGKMLAYAFETLPRIAWIVGQSVGSFLQMNCAAISGGSSAGKTSWSNAAGPHEGSDRRTRAFSVS